MRLLIIEDEPKVSEYLLKSFEIEGYKVKSEADGLAGLNTALEFKPDCVILDLMLPGMDGFTVLDRLKSSDPNTGVIILTARDEVADRVNGLDLGADDYITKPFSFEDLAARVRAVLRRKAPADITKIVVGDLILDTVKHTAEINGERIELTVKEYNLLELFMRNANNVLPREEINDKIWGDKNNKSSNIIDVYIKRLRTKIDGSGNVPKLQSARGVGYSLIDEQSMALMQKSQKMVRAI